MPTTPASTATAAPPSIARPGVRACRRTASGGADQHGEHEQRAEALDRHGHRRGEQHEQDEPQQRPGAGPAAAAPAGSNATADSGRCRATSAAPPSASSSAGGDQVAVGHAQRVAEQELLEPLRRVGREREQRSEAHEAGHRHGRAGVGPDARVARGEGDQRGGHERAARGAEQQRRAGERREHEAREQPVRERLGAVGEPLGHDPEAERAAEAADQGKLEQRPAVDAGAQRVERGSRAPPRQ